MNTIRYGVKTSGGSWYLIEDHTHIFGAPTWKLLKQDGEFIIAGLIAEGKEPIKAKDLKSIKQFHKYQIFYDKRKWDAATIVMPHTSSVEDIIEFK